MGFFLSNSDFIKCSFRYQKHDWLIASCHSWSLSHLIEITIDQTGELFIRLFTAQGTECCGLKCCCISFSRYYQECDRACMTFRNLYSSKSPECQVLYPNTHYYSCGVGPKYVIARDSNSDLSIRDLMPFAFVCWTKASQIPGETCNIWTWRLRFSITTKMCFYLNFPLRTRGSCWNILIFKYNYHKYL